MPETRPGHGESRITTPGDAAFDRFYCLRGLGLLALAAAGRGHVDRRGVGHVARLRLTAEGEHGLVGGRALLAVPALDVDDDDLARLQLAEQDLLRQLVLDLALDGAAQRPGTQHLVEPAGGEQLL